MKYILNLKMIWLLLKSGYNVAEFEQIVIILNYAI